MIREESDENADTWQPRTTGDRGERERAHGREL